jgi:hypothetical protein
MYEKASRLKRINALEAFLHQQSLQHGNLYSSSIQIQQPVFFHLVQRIANVQTAVVQLVSQLLHQDVERLGPCGIDASGEKEAYYALTQRLGS